jgi:hypothetical protein
MGVAIFRPPDKLISEYIQEDTEKCSRSLIWSALTVLVGRNEGENEQSVRIACFWGDLSLRRPEYGSVTLLT